MKLYHVSPQHYTDAILEEGLDPMKCREPRGRVWFYTNERQAKLHAGYGSKHASNVWVVDEGDLLGIDIETHWDTPWDDKACYVTMSSRRTC
jgi:hypothetical protein